MTFLKKKFIALTTTDAQLQQAAKNLAKQYAFPYVALSQQKNFTFLLVLSTEGLALKSLEKKAWADLRIDFLKGSLGYRLRHLQSQKQLLSKAVGSKILLTTSILDLTAGLGTDGFVLAQLGFSVTLLERSPIIAALLQNGLERALDYKKYSTSNIQLIQTDAKLYLNQLEKKERPDIIYLDPMYPPLKNSALVKKEMRFLREIVGDDTDAETLLPLALKHARKRVIVKRARLAPYLSNLKPTHSIFGKQLRFDIYLATNT
jgi:16S rRNA (guanine1516-N2)-methyltransferase